MITLRIKKTVIPVIAITLSLYFMFSMPRAVAYGVTEGLKICFYTVLPALFPFMTLSSYIVKSDVLAPLYKIISPVTIFLFRQPPVAAGVILMSMTGGFPIGAKMTETLLKCGKITQNQAQRLNMFCVSCGPAFAVSVIGASIYKSVRAGWIIYASLCISCLILGIITRFFDNGRAVNAGSLSSSQPPLAALSAAVGETVQSTLAVCAWIVLFSALISCIKASGMREPLYSSAVCLLEVTSGCKIAAQKFSVPVVAAVAGFGGFCVHFQILSSIGESGLKYKRFIAGRAVSGALSALICQTLLSVFPVELSTASFDMPVEAVPFSVSIPAFFALTAMCIIMIFDIDTRKKMW